MMVFGGDGSHCSAVHDLLLVSGRHDIEA